MAKFNIRYSTITIYNAVVEAESQDEAVDILMGGECDEGEYYDSSMDEVISVTKMED